MGKWYQSFSTKGNCSLSACRLSGNVDLFEFWPETSKLEQKEVDFDLQTVRNMTEKRDSCNMNHDTFSHRFWELHMVHKQGSSLEMADTEASQISLPRGQKRD